MNHFLQIENMFGFFYEDLSVKRKWILSFTFTGLVIGIDYYYDRDYWFTE